MSNKEEPGNEFARENSNLTSENLEEENFQDLEKARRNTRIFRKSYRKMNIDIEYHVRENGKKYSLTLMVKTLDYSLESTGETLEAFRIILKNSSGKNGYAYWFDVDVSGYKKRREETLTKLACKWLQK